MKKAIYVVLKVVEDQLVIEGYANRQRVNTIPEKDNAWLVDQSKLKNRRICDTHPAIIVAHPQVDIYFVTTQGLMPKYTYLEAASEFEALLENPGSITILNFIKNTVVSFNKLDGDVKVHFGMSGVKEMPCTFFFEKYTPELYKNKPALEASQSKPAAAPPEWFAPGHYQSSKREREFESCIPDAITLAELQGNMKTKYINVLLGAFAPNAKMLGFIVSGSDKDPSVFGSIILDTETAVSLSNTSMLVKETALDCYTSGDLRIHFLIGSPVKGSTLINSVKCSLPTPIAYTLMDIIKQEIEAYNASFTPHETFTPKSRSDMLFEEFYELERLSGNVGKVY